MNVLLPIVVMGLACSANGVEPSPSDALRTRFGAVRELPAANVFDRPLFMTSTDSPGSLTGDIYAIVDHPFDTVRQALSHPDDWCQVLILHLNIKYCRASGAPAHELLDVGIGRKSDQPLTDVYWSRFDYRSTGADSDYFAVALESPKGPLGTTDYRIAFESAPVSPRASLLHMTYSYAQGMTATVAMRAYLATIGNGKVGFSVAGRRANGEAIPVAGMRGVLERNTMRYFLAIEAHLGAWALPARDRQRKALQDWFTATERYATQLHDVDRETYIAMKSRELLRQETVNPPASTR